MAGVVLQQSTGTYVSVVITASYFARNIYKVFSSADVTAGKPVKIIGSCGPKGDPKSEYVAYVFVFIGSIGVGPFYI
jgi:hypothetical protein